MVVPDSNTRDAAPASAAVVGPPAFADVYREHARFLFRVLRRLGVAAKDVEDVCQDVFVIVHRKLPEFEQRSSVRTWLYGIALRCASDYRRRAHVVRETGPASDDLELPIDPDQPHSIAQRQARAVLDRIIDGLDDDKRAVFVLYELEELTMAEVTAIVGCPLQTGYSRLNAARSAVEAAVARLPGRTS